MKILQVSKYFYVKGGSERVFFDTIRILEEHGHEVVTFSMKDDKNFPSAYSDYFIDNIDFTKSDGLAGALKKAGHFLYSFGAREKLEELIKKERPDVAHLHNFTHQLTISILGVFKKYKIPVVQTLHDYQLVCPNYRMFTEAEVCERCRPRKFYNAILHRCVGDSYLKSALSCVDLYFQRLFKLYEERVDAFIAPSAFLQKKMQEWGVKKSIHHIPYSVNIEQYKPIYEPGTYLLYVGRLSDEKGIETLIRAMRELPALNLKIVGSGPMKPRLVNFVNKKQIANVEFLGYRQGQALEDIIRYSRFVVVPSEWYENYPMALLEAMAMGKPIIGSQIGGIPEMIDEEKTGWLFAPRDVADLREKIKVAAADDATLFEYGKNARQRVEQINCSSKYYDTLMKIYKRIQSNYAN
jgi:glycosyltransferase involved in cell wall biosynthesis